MAQNIVVGGDFRAFLNALAHPEESTIARFLPYRPGHKGLQLAEAIAQTMSLFDLSERLYLLERAGAPIQAKDRRETLLLSNEQQKAAYNRARAHLEIVFKWFEGSREQLEDAFAEGSGQLERVFVPLEDVQLEKTCLWLTKQTLGLEEEPAKKQKKGFFSRLFSR
jgi:hypothetical protein